MIENLLLFSVRKQDDIIVHMKHKRISKDILMKYLGQLVERLKWNIASETPDKFAVMFDGWSIGGTHFFQYFLFSANDHEKWKCICVGFSPLKREDGQFAE